MEKVVILIINYNQNQYTADCIKSILASDHQNFKIILVDNEAEAGNSIRLKQILPDDDRILVYPLFPNRGYVGGINYSFSIIDEENKYDYILIMNNDTIIDPCAISALIKTCKNFNNMAIVSGKVYDYERKNVLQYVGSVITDTKLLTYESIGYNIEDKGQFDKLADRDLLDDIFWLMPKELHKRIGGYNDLFFFNGESSDFAIRAKKAGYRLVYTPVAKLWHKGSLSIGGRKGNPFIEYWQMRSALTFKYLHLPNTYFRKFLMWKVKNVVSGYIKFLIAALKGTPISIKIPNARLKGLIDFYIKVKPVAKRQRLSI